MHAEFPDLPIVILTMHGDEALRQEAVAAAAGFITKDVSMQEVVKTVTEAAGGDVALDRAGGHDPRRVETAPTALRHH